MAFSPIISWQTDGERMETVTQFISPSSKITADSDCSHEIKISAPWKISYDKPRQCIKKRRHYFAYKGPYSESYGFPSNHVWILELDNKKRLSTKELMPFNCGAGKDF